MNDFVHAVVNMVDRKLAGINTVDVAILTEFDPATYRANVQLKRKVNGTTVEIFNVPVMFPYYNGCAFVIHPAPGDVVLVVYSKFEVEEQLINRDVVEVNGVLRFDLNNAVVIGGLVTTQDLPVAIGVDEAGMFHKSGSYLKFKANGDIEAGVTSHFDVIKRGG